MESLAVTNPFVKFEDWYPWLVMTLDRIAENEWDAALRTHASHIGGPLHHQVVVLRVEGCGNLCYSIQVHDNVLQMVTFTILGPI